MSKNVIVDNVEYNGVSIIQLETAEGGVAQFHDLDDMTGGLEFTKKVEIDVTGIAGRKYWRASSILTNGYVPAHEYGIILVDFVGTHLGSESKNGIQTQMFVYTPTAYRYVGWGYRSGNSAQSDNRIDGVRGSETESLQTAETANGNGTMYTGYIPEGATVAVFSEAELTKEVADILMAIMSGSAGYTAS